MNRNCRNCKHGALMSNGKGMECKVDRDCPVTLRKSHTEEGYLPSYKCGSEYKYYENRIVSKIVHTGIIVGIALITKIIGVW